MSFNLKLGFGMAQVYGFTTLHPQGVYYPRHLFALPSVPYCLYVLRKFREEQKRGGERIQGSDATGRPDDTSGNAGEGNRAS